MTVPRVPVTFEPSGFTAWVEPGQTVLAAGRAAGVNISAPCGGRGICGSCGVRVLDGSLAQPTADEIAALLRAPDGIRLACRATIAGPVTLRPILENSTVKREMARLEGDDALVVGIDLGTTSVSAAVLEQHTGRQIGSATVWNRQAAYGADILSRISAALEGEDVQLQSLAETSVLDAVDSAAGGARERVKRVVIAGNVAMAALLTRVDVRSLAAHPFSVPSGCGTVPQGSALRSAFSSASIDVVPAAAGFVGGDVLAGLVALGVAETDGARLLVDVGTNAEVAFVHAGKVWVSSAAAGPAFEGGGISCGGPPTAESVRAVNVGTDGTVEVHATGDVSPLWFSGAGLVSAVAALRRAGHIDSDGRMEARGPLRDRFSTDRDGVLGVALGDRGDLSITQLDVRALQLAKAAVRVALTSVLRHAGFDPRCLDALYVSGAFGAALSPRDLVELGVVPREAAAAVAQAGNTSLRGAAAMAMDSSAMDSAHDLAAHVVLVDLAASAEFAKDLMAGLELGPYSV